MTVTCTISRADLKAQNYKAATKLSTGTSPKKRDVALVAMLLQKVATK